MKVPHIKPWGQCSTSREDGDETLPCQAAKANNRDLVKEINQKGIVDEGQRHGRPNLLGRQTWR